MSSPGPLSTSHMEAMVLPDETFSLNGKHLFVMPLPQCMSVSRVVTDTGYSQTFNGAIEEASYGLWEI